MSFVYIPGKAAKLPFAVPQGSCCNCGSTHAVALTETPLKKTRYMVLGGTELAFTIELPYCKTCVVTAPRFPVGLFTKLFISFGVFWVLLLLAVALSAYFSKPLPSSYLPHTLGVIAVLLTLGFYSLRKAKPPQTSYYQPVTLKAVKQQFTGGIVGMSLFCTNQSFASQFSSLNAELVSSGALKVAHA